MNISIFAKNHEMIPKIILRLTGWKMTGEFTSDIRKCVLVVAPHTSNMDFIIGRMVFNALRVKVRFLIKKEAFVFPLGFFLKKWGGVPVERNRRTNLVEQLVKRFEEADELVLAITPEGTRSRVTSWKKGFYYVAMKSNVPIVLGFLDYGKKVAGLGPVFYPSGDYEKDSRVIQDFYSDKTARYPDKFNIDAIRPR